MFSDRAEPALLRQPARAHLCIASRVRALVRGWPRRAHEYALHPGEVFLVGARDGRAAGDRRRMDAVPARSPSVRPPCRPARGRDRGGRLPAGVLWASGAQRRGHAAAAHALAVWQRRRYAIWAEARLCDSRGSGLGWPARASTRPASRSCRSTVAAAAHYLDSIGGTRNSRLPAERWAPCGAWHSAGGVCALVSFLLANPYALLDFKLFHSELVHQSSLSDEAQGKLGAPKEIGIFYYLWSFSWGLGWVPAVAALGGAITIWRRHARIGWLLVPAPILFLGIHGPAGPLLRALAAADLPDRVSARRLFCLAARACRRRKGHVPRACRGHTAKTQMSRTGRQSPTSIWRACA